MLPELQIAINFANDNILLAEQGIKALPADNDVRKFVKSAVTKMRMWSIFGREPSFYDPPEPFPKFKLAKQLIGGGPGKILDVGTYTGFFIRYICKGSRLHGVGVDLFDMHKAVALATREGVSAEFGKLPAQYIGMKWENEFDFVTCFDALEHVFHEDVVIRGIEHVAKDGALIIYNLPLWSEMIVPEDTDPMKLLVQYANAEHLRPYTKERVLELFGDRKEFTMHPMQDEHGAKTLFFTYRK
jgi:2-polyprenyl-3-methyl-5-hydroxy-6-metoxy-1,4-benzoquinol methylase